MATGGSDGETAKGPPGCCLFVYHIPVTWADCDLSQCFAPLAPPGNLLSATVFKDKATGVSKGFGFVNYDNPVSANNAITAMHGMAIEGKKLRVEIKKQKGAPGTGGGAGSAALTAQSQQMHALAMQQMALQWGMAPGLAQAGLGGMSGMGAGLGAMGGMGALGGMSGMEGMQQAAAAQPAYDPYAQSYANMYQDPSMAGLTGGMASFAQTTGMGGMGAAAAVGAYGLSTTPGLGGMQQQVAGQPKKTGPPNACLFIYHIPITWTDNDLAQCFAPFAPPGNIINALVYKDKNTGASKGFGFVDYDNPISAQSAIAGMNGMSVDSGKRLRVEIKKARPGQPY